MLFVLKVINDRHIKTNGLYFDKWIIQFFSGLTTIRIPKRQIHFAHVECFKIGQKLKVDTNMTCHACLESWTCPQYDVLI